MSSARQPAPTGAPSIIPNARALDDRLGELMRRHHHGLIRPLWADAPEIVKQYWRDRAPAFQTLLASVGLKVVIDEEGR